MIRFLTKKIRDSSVTRNPFTNGVSVSSTSVRSETFNGKRQENHSTAYSLYCEFIYQDAISLLDKDPISADSIDAFVARIIFMINAQDQLMSLFIVDKRSEEQGLYDPDYENERLDTRKKQNQELIVQLNLKVKAIKSKLSANNDKLLIIKRALADSSHGETVDSEIKQDIKDYFTDVITYVGDNFLRSQNAQPYISFMNDIDPRDYEDSNYGEEDGARQVSGQKEKNALAFLRNTTVQQQSQAQVEAQVEAQVAAMLDLLDYSPVGDYNLQASVTIRAGRKTTPPSRYTDLIPTPKATDERDDSLNMLGYIIIRHLLFIYITFPKLHYNWDKIVDGFIIKKIEEFGITDDVVSKDNKCKNLMLTVLQEYIGDIKRQLTERTLEYNKLQSDFQHAQQAESSSNVTRNQLPFVFPAIIIPSDMEGEHQPLICFTDLRPQTIFRDVQKQHTISYALFIELAMKIANDSLSGYPEALSISCFMSSITGITQNVIRFMDAFELCKAPQMDKVLDIRFGMNTAHNEASARITGLKNLISISGLKKEEQDFLSERIKEIRNRYAIRIFASAASQFLRNENMNPYVSLLQDESSHKPRNINEGNVLENLRKHRENPSVLEQVIAGDILKLLDYTSGDAKFNKHEVNVLLFLLTKLLYYVYRAFGDFGSTARWDNIVRFCLEKKLTEINVKNKEECVLRIVNGLESAIAIDDRVKQRNMSDTFSLRSTASEEDMLSLFDDKSHASGAVIFSRESSSGDMKSVYDSSGMSSKPGSISSLKSSFSL